MATTIATTTKSISLKEVSVSEGSHIISISRNKRQLSVYSLHHVYLRWEEKGKTKLNLEKFFHLDRLPRHQLIMEWEIYSILYGNLRHKALQDLK